VVPSPKPETFVIEVASARVAVHGTAFRVERRASEFAVSVSEGEVAVGPIGQRDGTSGWRLTHGDSGQFSFDGKTGTVQHADAVVIAPSQPAVEAPVEPGKPVASARPIKPLTPSSEEITRTVGAVESAALACFVEHTPAGEVRVQVQTRLTVGIGPDGKVHQVSFDPPLSPAITECVHAEAAKLRIRESEQGGTGSRLLLLGS
jgi:hypothetical protein